MVLEAVAVGLTSDLAVSFVVVVGVLIKASPALAEARGREGLKLCSVDVAYVVSHFLASFH
jgi:hypothetical protein